ncbi:MAG TPA: PilN domain-containing protein [Patescibacteria group bacterium]|nr:PilN domain-containing protein [Patescibacteria group bacterium]
MEIKINLLPDYRKEEIAKSNRFQMVIRLGMVVLSVFVFFYLFLFGLLNALEIEINSVTLSQKMASNSDQLKKIKEFDAHFERINSDSKQALSFEKDQFYWINLFDRLGQNMSDGITITDLATKDYKVLLAGKAFSRDMLMEYKEKLSQEKCFSEINLPLSNLVSKEDISFQMDMKINRDCLRLGTK